MTNPSPLKICCRRRDGTSSIRQLTIDDPRLNIRFADAMSIIYRFTGDVDEDGRPVYEEIETVKEPL